jgi:cellulose synthase/poly-beta-1,6-N-acetylglucosamine synthase-like glycosyltransferase
LHLLFLLAIAILGVQIIYLSLFLRAFSIKRNHEDRSAQPLSVIVCAHDEEPNLRELIPLLMKQNHPEFEVIIVEDRCNDATYDFLLAETKKEERLKMVRVVQKPEHIHGKKFGLTLGIKAAKYPWVLLTDADCRPASDDWLKSMSSHFNGTLQIVLGFSSYYRSAGLLNAFIRFETFLTGIQYLAFAQLGFPYMGVGRNLAYQKSFFISNKGFNDYLGLVGGDDDLFVNKHATKQNTITAIGARELIFSKPKTSWKEFYYQKVRHLAVGRRYGIRSKMVLGLFSLSWIGVWILAIPSAGLMPGWMWIAGLLGCRWILMIILFSYVPRQIGDRFEAWKVPFLDFIYAFYYLVAGFMAMVSKKIKWRI